MSQHSTLKQTFAGYVQQFHKLQDTPLRKDSDEYQAQLAIIIQQWIDLKSTITRSAIFSSNETIDDISTSEIKYLATDFYLAQLYPEFATPAKTINIKKALMCYLHFLTNLNNYGLLSKEEVGKYDKLKEKPFEITVLHQTAMLRREDKIANFKFEKQLTLKLQTLERLETDENEYQNADDEDVRQLYFDQLKLFTIKTFDNIRTLTQELEILQHFEREQPSDQQAIQDDDDRAKKRSDPTNFTEKLETINKGVLSKEGKILRPFTLLKREDLKNKVFGTGQYLPTVTVEEFLEQELANGGMITGGGNDGPQEESSDEDDMDKEDAKTYKARQCDDFTEANVKGSGNTMNRG